MNTLEMDKKKLARIIGTHQAYWRQWPPEVAAEKKKALAGPLFKM